MHMALNAIGERLGRPFSESRQVQRMTLINKSVVTAVPRFRKHREATRGTDRDCIDFVLLTAIGQCSVAENSCFGACRAQTTLNDFERLSAAAPLAADLTPCNMPTNSGVDTQVLNWEVDSIGPTVSFVFLRVQLKTLQLRSLLMMMLMMMLQAMIRPLAATVATSGAE